jgi:hypothetical protein
MDRAFLVRFLLIGLAVVVGQSCALAQMGIDSGRDAPGLSALVAVITRSVVSGEFSKKADHGKWFGAKAKNHQQKEYHDPPEAER